MTEADAAPSEGDELPDSASGTESSLVRSFGRFLGSAARWATSLVGVTPHAVPYADEAHDAPPGTLEAKLGELLEIIEEHEKQGFDALLADPAFWTVLNQLLVLRPEDTDAADAESGSDGPERTRPAGADEADSDDESEGSPKKATGGRAKRGKKKDEAASATGGSDPATSGEGDETPKEDEDDNAD